MSRNNGSLIEFVNSSTGRRELGDFAHDLDTQGCPHHGARGEHYPVKCPRSYAERSGARSSVG